MLMNKNWPDSREPYWEYMGRKLREGRVKKKIIGQEDMWKKEIAEMQKTLYWCYNRIRELNDEIYEIKSGITDAQLEMTRVKNVDKEQMELKF